METPLWIFVFFAAVSVLTSVGANMATTTLWLIKLNMHRGEEIDLKVASNKVNFKAVIGTSVRARYTTKSTINFEFTVGQAKQVVAITEHDQHEPVLTPEPQTNDAFLWTGERAHIKTDSQRNQVWQSDILNGPMYNVIKNYLKE